MSPIHGRKSRTGVLHMTTTILSSVFKLGCLRTALMLLGLMLGEAAIAQQPLPDPNLFLTRNVSIGAIARQADGKLLVVTHGVADARYLGVPPEIDSAGNPVGFSGTFPNGLLRLNADGSRDATFTVDLLADRGSNMSSGDIFDIKIFGNFAYVLGNFSVIGGVARAGLARINLTTNVVDAAWNPNPVRRIANQIAVGNIALDGGGNLYTFGSLYDIGGKTNVRMAKIPATSVNGQADANFDGRQATTNSPNDIVATVGIFAAPVPNGALYVIGRKVIASASQNMRVYKINALTGVQDAAWNADLLAIDMNVNTAVVNAAGDIFVSGQSTGTSTLGQNLTSPYSLVKLSGVTGQVASGWIGGLNIPLVNNLPNYTIRLHIGLSLDTAGSLYATAARFYGDTLQLFPAKYDANSGLPVAGFNGQIIEGGNSFNGTVLATADGIYVEGRDYYGSVRSGALLKLDAASGAAVGNFNVNIKNSGFVSTSTRLDDGRVVMGGSFTEANGVAVNNLMRFNTDGTFDPTFTTGPSGLVANVKHIAGKLYASGAFAYSGTAPRQLIARYDALSGALDTTWSPVIDGMARAITGDADNIYMVGGFYTVNGAVTRCLAKVSAVTGQADLAWQPLLANMSFGSLCQRAIAKVGNFVYVGMPNNQNFSGVPRIVVNGQNRSLARIDATTGQVDNSFDPNPNGPVNAMDFDGSNIYLSGGFTSIGGVATRLAKIVGATGTIDQSFVQPLTGIPNNPTWIRGTPAAIFVIGSEFLITNQDVRPYVWKIFPNGSRDAAWLPQFEFDDQGNAFNSAVEPLGANRVMVGGGFNDVGNPVRLRLGVAAFSTVAPTNLTLNISGRGTVDVTSNGGAANAQCFDCAGGPFVYEFDTASSVTLTFRPAPGWVFVGWQGNNGAAGCGGIGACTFTLSTATSVSAAFRNSGNFMAQ